MKATIAVDFDGVIHRYSRGWLDGTIYDEPVEGALASLGMLQLDYAIVVFTTRDNQEVAKWLLQRGVEVYAPEGKWERYPFWNSQEQILVTNLKPAAALYIDDRALAFENWYRVFEVLRF